MRIAITKSLAGRASNARKMGKQLPRWHAPLALLYRRLGWHRAQIPSEDRINQDTIN
jgi:hypothetical protein